MCQSIVHDVVAANEVWAQLHRRCRPLAAVRLQHIITRCCSYKSSRPPARRTWLTSQRPESRHRQCTIHLVTLRRVISSLFSPSRPDRFMRRSSSRRLRPVLISPSDATSSLSTSMPAT